MDALPSGHDLAQDGVHRGAILLAAADPDGFLATVRPVVAPKAGAAGLSPVSDVRRRARQGMEVPPCKAGRHHRMRKTTRPAAHVILRRRIAINSTGRSYRPSMARRTSLRK